MRVFGFNLTIFYFFYLHSVQLHELINNHSQFINKKNHFLFTWRAMNQVNERLKAKHLKQMRPLLICYWFSSLGRCRFITVFLVESHEILLRLVTVYGTFIKHNLDEGPSMQGHVRQPINFLTTYLNDKTSNNCSIQSNKANN